MAERTEQKRRRRDDLLNGARTLLQQGKAVTVTAAAREAGMSKATAYRYYSDPALLVAEAGLDFRAKSYEGMVEGCGTVRERLTAISLHFFDLALENETAFRTYLGLFLQASVLEGAEAPERGARRVKAFRRALEEAEPPIGEDRVEQTAAALSVATGPEAMIALIDVARCSRHEARDLVEEIAHAMVDRFLGRDLA
jgi:AcrR family transcriptional regulator